MEKEAAQSAPVPDDLREIVNRIAQDAEDMDLRLSEFKFIHTTKMLGVAVGGAVFVLGILFILISLFIFFDLFSVLFPYKIRIAISSVSVVLGLLQLLAGILLIGK